MQNHKNIFFSISGMILKMFKKRTKIWISRDSFRKNAFHSTPPEGSSVINLHTFMELSVLMKWYYNTCICYDMWLVKKLSQGKEESWPGLAGRDEICGVRCALWKPHNLYALIPEICCRNGFYVAQQVSTIPLRFIELLLILSNVISRLFDIQLNTSDKIWMLSLYSY